MKPGWSNCKASFGVSGSGGQVVLASSEPCSPLWHGWSGVGEQQRLGAAGEL